MTAQDFSFFRNSQQVLHRFLKPGAPEDDELVFLEFRPGWLTPQRNVYAAFTRPPCAICMFDIHPLLLVRQHNPQHPPLCKECFSQLLTCPFCRIDLRFPRIHHRLIRIM